MTTFNKDSSRAEVLQNCPGAAEIFSEHGLNCCECMGADVETIGQGALLHGLDIDELLKHLNSACPNDQKGN
jgi:hybrid cluster-associated redox disulfide protein